MRVSVSERLAHLRSLLRSAIALSFDDAVRGADRMTVAVTLWALLELHRRGEASWEQTEPFGEITVRARGRADVSELARIVEALLFLASDPVAVVELAQATGASEEEVGAALEELAAAYEPGSRGILLRELAGGYTLASDPVAEDAARDAPGEAAPRDADAGPARDARDRRLSAAGLAARDRADPRCQRRLAGRHAARPRAGRGARPLAVRGRALPDDARSSSSCSAWRRPGELPDIAQWDPTPEEQRELRDRLLAAGEARAGIAPDG